MQPSRSTVLSYTEMYGTCWREQTPFHAMQNKTEQKEDPSKRMDTAMKAVVASYFYVLSDDIR
jgi:hypothetical protein